MNRKPAILLAPFVAPARASLARGRRVVAPPQFANRGVTLVEILLALSIMALIAAAVSSMLFTVSTGTQRDADQRRRNVTVDLTSHRIDSAIRSSAMLLAAGDDFLVLWTGDSNGNRRPNLSELRRIEFDASENVVRSFTGAHDLHEDDDPAFELGDDFDAITRGLRDTAVFPGQNWARRASDLAFTPDTMVATKARAVRYTLTLEDDHGSFSLHSTASLRGQSAP